MDFITVVTKAAEAPLVMLITYIIIAGSKWTKIAPYARQRFRDHHLGLKAAVICAVIVLLYEYTGPVFRKIPTPGAVVSFATSLCFVIWLYPKLSKPRAHFLSPCGGCGALVNFTEPWVCGHCDHTNSRYLYLDCEKCGQVASVMYCSKCKAPVTMAEPADFIHAARKAGDSIPLPKPEAVVDREAERKEERARREHEIVMARLDAELAQEKARHKALERQLQEQPKPRTLEEDSAAHQDAYVKIHEITEAKIAEAKQKYKNNREMRERAIESIYAWRDKHT